MFFIAPPPFISPPLEVWKPDPAHDVVQHILAFELFGEKKGVGVGGGDKWGKIQDYTGVSETGNPASDFAEVHKEICICSCFIQPWKSCLGLVRIRALERSQEHLWCDSVSLFCKYLAILTKPKEAYIRMKLWKEVKLVHVNYLWFRRSLRLLLRMPCGKLKSEAFWNWT